MDIKDKINRANELIAALPEERQQKWNTLYGVLIRAYTRELAKPSKSMQRVEEQVDNLIHLLETLHQDTSVKNPSWEGLV